MDSITTPGCAPQTLELVFAKRIRCNSIAANGSDFTVTDGPYPVTVTGASADCTDGLSFKIYVQLGAPLQVAGTFKISLVQGNDGNTLIDECGQESLTGFLNFNVKDTVNAGYSSVIKLGCKLDTVQFYHNGQNTVNSWLWDFDGLFTSSEQNPSVAYNIFGTHQVHLIVSNGVCYDTVANSIFLRNTLNAKFDATMLICPGDPATFKDLSEQASPGNDIVAWSWNFANGSTSNLQNPPQQYYDFHSADYYAPVVLIVQDFIGCKDTTVLNLNILHNCFIAVPSAFSPNNDGLNDYLYPLNAYKAADLKFSVYNRFGQRIFYTNDWTNKWNGTFKGQGCDPGTYVWMLEYYNMKSYKPVFQKGTVVLIR
jgi:gliding motility-associated-like protein